MTADLTGAWIDTHPTLPTDVLTRARATITRHATDAEDAHRIAWPCGLIDGPSPFPPPPAELMRCGHPTTARRRVPEYRGRGFECVTCKSERRHG